MTSRLPWNVNEMSRDIPRNDHECLSLSYQVVVWYPTDYNGLLIVTMRFSGKRRRELTMLSQCVHAATYNVHGMSMSIHALLCAHATACPGQYDRRTRCFREVAALLP